MTPPVSFFTKCWERDWRRVLDRGGARVQAARCLYPFAARTVLINNVADRKQLHEAGDHAILRGDIDAYAFVEDEIDRTLDFFRLTRKALGKGYVYSICEMTEILLARTPYLVHFAGDVALPGPAGWIRRGVEILQADPQIAVVNPVWNGRLWEARAESIEDRGDHYVGYGFSDQAYLVRVVDFRADILRETHPASKRYPSYGGDLFEKRVDSWMRNHDRLRATFKEVMYRHPIAVADPSRVEDLSPCVTLP